MQISGVTGHCQAGLLSQRKEDENEKHRAEMNRWHSPKQCTFPRQWVWQISSSVCVHGVDLFTKTGAACASSR